MVFTKVYRVDPLNPPDEILKECGRIILNDGIVIFPTETVYGLGASAFSPKAVKRIYVAKGRPLDNPLIVHISKLSQLEEVAIDIPDKAWDLAKRVWPGPLTMVLKRNPKIAKEVTAGLETVAVRMPAHPVALKLIDYSTPLAAPSANLSGRPSPTTAHHVLIDMYGRVDAIIDAGETFFGVESTIVNLVTEPPILLRPGPIPVEVLRELLGEDIVVTEVAKGFKESSQALAPGMKYRHYAPQTKLLLVESRSYDDLERYIDKVRKVALSMLGKGLKIAVVASKESAELYKDLNVKIVVLGSRRNLYEVAKNLFTVLREIDKLAVDIAIVEGFPEHGVGLAIMNRLRKASGYNIVKVDDDTAVN